MASELDRIAPARLLRLRDPDHALGEIARLAGFDAVAIEQGAAGDNSGARGPLRRELFNAGFLPLLDRAGLGEGGIYYIRSSCLTDRASVGVEASDGVSMTKLAHRGRFANQVFQYAFLRLYALRNHLTPKVPEWQGEEIFGLEDARAGFNEYPDIFLDSFEEDDLVLWEADVPPANVNFDGPFQEVPDCWRPHRHFLRLLFAPRPGWNEELLALNNALRGRTLVAIHVRHGDYADVTATGSPFRRTPLEWYGERLKEIWPSLTDPILHVATDGGAEVKRFFSAWPQLPDALLPVSIPADLRDFFILRQAAALLICNSSFSRMAALLADNRQQVFLSDFEARRFQPYNAWDDRAFWPRFHPAKRGDILSRMRQVSMQLRQALGAALHRPSGSLPVLASPEPAPCRTCNGQTLLHQVLDFNTWDASVPRPLSGAPIYYRRCSSCGFVFTASFDHWPPYDFQRHIYNEDFFATDPGFLLERPARRAGEIIGLFPRRDTLAILDYGGLNFATTEALGTAGFARVARLDLLDSGQPEVKGPFDIVSCCDVLERVPDPREIAREIAGLLREDGVIVCATRMQPVAGAPPASFGPRQGHVSLFSPDAVAALWWPFGLRTVMLGDGWHIAFRRLPEFARHLVPGHPAT